MRFLSLLLGKSILKLLRLTGKGNGSALPGLVVEKINPAFLRTMLKQLPMGVVIVTGTNGKTTTTKTLTDLLEAQGLRVLTNKSGSNFVRGTVGVVLKNASLSGKLPYDIAVFEQDEAHAVHFVHQVPPRGVVVLNIMRDQMDRFGEIDTTAKLLQQVASSATDWLVLNGNDERVSRLQGKGGVKTYYFEHSPVLQESFVTDDELHHQDNASFHTSSQPTAVLTGFTNDAVNVKLNGQMQQYPTGLTGSHNAINLVAALTAQSAVLPQADPTKIRGAVWGLKPAFGRGESFRLNDDTKVVLQLVKNPGGFTHVLRTLKLSPYNAVAIAINDDYADGRDVSWLWDVDFSVLKERQVPILTGGTRGYDMAVRLKYDDVPVTDTYLEFTELIDAANALGKQGTVVLLCTYTAMLKIRALYQKQSRDVKGVEI